jgi:hypothetical protein
VTSFDTPDLEGLFAGRVATTGQKSAAYFFVVDANVSRLSASMSRFTQRLWHWIAIILIRQATAIFHKEADRSRYSAAWTLELVLDF